MRNLLKIIFNRYRALFHDFFLEDLIGYIPVSVAEPAKDFMLSAGSKMEKWLLWQSHILQRKMVNEPENADIYRGMLLEIKILLMLIAQKREPLEPTKQIDAKKDDPNEVVADFIKRGKSK